MAKTFSGNSTTYCPALEFIKRYDARVLADLCGDQGARIGADADGNVSNATLAADTNLATALLDASGDFEEYLLAGHRYEIVDIAALPVGSPGLNKVYRIVSDLAYNYLVDRRPDKEWPESRTWKRTKLDLEGLASGERIFAFTETQDAGTMEFEVVTPAEITTRNGVVVQMENLFGRRADRRPGGT